MLSLFHHLHHFVQRCPGDPPHDQAHLLTLLMLLLSLRPMQRSEQHHPHEWVSPALNTRVSPSLLVGLAQYE